MIELQQQALNLITNILKIFSLRIMHKLLKIVHHLFNPISLTENERTMREYQKERKNIKN